MYSLTVGAESGLFSVGCQRFDTGSPHYLCTLLGVSTQPPGIQATTDRIHQAVTARIIGVAAAAAGPAEDCHQWGKPQPAERRHPGRRGRERPPAQAGPLPAREAYRQ